MSFYLRFKTLYKSQLRSTSAHFGVLSTSPCEEHLEIEGSKLPTYEQIILCYLAHLKKIKETNTKETNRVRWEVAKTVVEKVLIHYRKSGIVTKATNKIAQEIEKIYLEYLNVINRDKDRKNITDQLKKNLEKQFAFVQRKLKKI